MAEKGIRRGTKVSPRGRVQKVVIVRLTINRTPLNQSDSSNFAPLTITVLITITQMWDILNQVLGNFFL